MKTRRRVHDRRLAFAREYIIDLHVAAAMARAGYSRKTAAAQGTKLLKDPAVQAEIQRLQARTLARAELTAARVLEELRRVAFADIRQLFTPEGALIPLHELTDEAAAALASVEVVMKNAAAGDGVVDRVLKVRLWDKVPALVTLAKHFALLTDVVQVSGMVTFAEKIARARERGAKLATERAAAKA